MFTSPRWLESLIQEEALPTAFADLAVTYYLPVAHQIQSWRKKTTTPLVVGVNGAQGTGKSTLCRVLAEALEHEHHLSCAVISIDDIYLTRSERSHLAENVHPLLRTRGVPGTHDVEMGIKLINALKNGETPAIPAFDKAIDDRAPADEWITPDRPVDVILFEGWCVGAIAQQSQALATPINTLEDTEDQDGLWRTFANQQLRESYTELFSLMDRLVMLKAPDFECIYEWRKTQEDKLRQRSNGSNIMNAEEIARFIMHYERLSRWMFKEMPARADCVLELTPDHTIAQASYQKQLNSD